MAKKRNQNTGDGFRVESNDLQKIGRPVRSEDDFEASLNGEIYSIYHV